MAMSSWARSTMRGTSIPWLGKSIAIGAGCGGSGRTSPTRSAIWSRKPGGHWAFHYDIHGDADDDEGGYRLGNHKFAPGEYVSIREHDDDVLRTFRVVRVEALPAN